MNITKLSLEDLAEMLEKNQVDDIFNGLEKITMELEHVAEANEHYKMANLKALFMVADYLEKNHLIEKVSGALEFVSSVNTLRNDLRLLEKEIPVYDMYWDEVSKYVQQKKKILSKGKEGILRQEILKNQITVDAILNDSYKLFNVEQIFYTADMVMHFYQENEVSLEAEAEFIAFLRFAKDLKETLSPYMKNETFGDLKMSDFLDGFSLEEAEAMIKAFDYSDYFVSEELMNEKENVKKDSILRKAIKKIEDTPIGREYDRFKTVKQNVLVANQIIRDFVSHNYKFWALKDINYVASQAELYLNSTENYKFFMKDIRKYFGEFLRDVSVLERVVERFRKQEGFYDKTMTDLLEELTEEDIENLESIGISFVLTAEKEEETERKENAKEKNPSFKEFASDTLMQNYLMSDHKSEVIQSYRKLLETAPRFQANIIENFLDRIAQMEKEEVEQIIKETNETTKGQTLEEFVNMEVNGEIKETENIACLNNEEAREENESISESSTFEEIAANKRKVKDKLNSLLYLHVQLSSKLALECNIHTLFKYQELLHQMNEEYKSVDCDRYMSDMDDVSCDCAYGNGLILDYLLKPEMAQHGDMTFDQYQRSLLKDGVINNDTYLENMELYDSFTDNVSKFNHFYQEQDEDFKNELYVSNTEQFKARNSDNASLEKEDIEEEISVPPLKPKQVTLFSKFKKKIVATSVAAVTAIVAITGLGGFLNKKKEKVEPAVLESSSNQETTLLNAVADSIMESHKIEVPEEAIISPLEPVSTMRDELLNARKLLEEGKSKNDAIFIGNTVNLNRIDAPIYFTSYDVAYEENAHVNYYQMTEERVVQAVILEKDGDIKSAVTNEELAFLEQQGYIRKGYAVTNQFSKNHQDIEGRYHVDDIQLIRK